MPHDVPLDVNQLRTESRPASKFAGMRIHFIGIGGCGMSGLARMLLDSGAILSGSEPKPNPQTFELSGRGVRISRDQFGELLSRDVDLVVRSAAVNDDNAEFLAARAYGIPTIKYAEMLGQIMSERRGVAVAGTHGKSTTTAMISHALLRCGADPSFVVGGTVQQLGGGSRSGKSRIFVAEACEYDRSFHHLHPQVALITNIEEDHLDCYSGIDEIIESFHQFAATVPSDGLIIASAHDSNVKRALRGIAAPVETVALRAGSTWSTLIAGCNNGCYRGELFRNNQSITQFQLQVAGEHNLMNATMAIAACHACGIDAKQAADAVETFSGVDRRMSEIGRLHGAIVVDDYGHHPTEIRATLQALRQRYQPRRLLCVFQPHQHSRTRFLLKDFASSFAEADATIVPDIYFVRDSEAERQRISSTELVSRIQANGQRAMHLSGFDQIVAYLIGEAREGDLIVTMGAGNVWEIARDLVAADH